MKKCPQCGNEMYPSISTAVLVLVRKDDKLLLVHAHNFRGTFNSLVAGFLETGETLEECVAREYTGHEARTNYKRTTNEWNETCILPSKVSINPCALVTCFLNKPRELFHESKLFQF